MSNIDFKQLEKWSDNIINTSYENWSEELYNYALHAPIFSISLSVNELECLALQNYSYRSFLNKNVKPAIPKIQLPKEIERYDGSFFPKLGPVSWKEIPIWTCIESKMFSSIFPHMLASITDRLAGIIHIYLKQECSLNVHLFPYINIAEQGGKEVRIEIINGHIKRGHWLFDCVANLDTQEKRKVNSILLDLTEALVQNLQIKNAVLDLCLIERESAFDLKIIDINPILIKGCEKLYD